MLIVIESCFTIGGSKRDQGACLAQLIKLAANNTHAQSPRPAVQPKIKIRNTSCHFVGAVCCLTQTNILSISQVWGGGIWGRIGYSGVGVADYYSRYHLQVGPLTNFISTLYLSVASTCKFLQFSSHHFLDKGPDECDGSS